MANATLVTQKVQEIHLSNKLEKSGQIQLDSSFSLNVSFSSDGSRCVGKLQQTLRDKEFVGGKFTMTVELVGIFNCSNATTDAKCMGRSMTSFFRTCSPSVPAWLLPRGFPD